MCAKRAPYFRPSTFSLSGRYELQSTTMHKEYKTKKNKKKKKKKKKNGIKSCITSASLNLAPSLRRGRFTRVPRRARLVPLSATRVAARTRHDFRRLIKITLALQTQRGRDLCAPTSSTILPSGRVRLTTATIALHEQNSQATGPTQKHNKNN